jgi:hypothetical protein
VANRMMKLGAESRHPPIGMSAASQYPVVIRMLPVSSAKSCTRCLSVLARYDSVMLVSPVLLGRGPRSERVFVFYAGGKLRVDKARRLGSKGSHVRPNDAYG